MRCSISRTGRQLSIDKNERHGGSDAGDSPLLRERQASAGEGDVVIGGEQGDQTDEQARDGLQPAKPIEAWPGTRGIERFWRIRPKGLHARKLRMQLPGFRDGAAGCPCSDWQARQHQDLSKLEPVIPPTV